MESGGQIDRRSLTITSLDPVHFQNKKKPFRALQDGFFSISDGDLFTQNYHKQSFQGQHRDFPTCHHRH